MFGLLGAAATWAREAKRCIKRSSHRSTSFKLLTWKCEVNLSKCEISGHIIEGCRRTQACNHEFCGR